MNFTSRLRQWHAYIGLFIAPSVLFFALTGAVQIFSLHESHGNYRPFVLVEKLSAVHKDQVFEQPHDHLAQGDQPESSPSAAVAPDEHHTDDDDGKNSASTLALKWFFFCVSAGLTASTLIGVWMGTTLLRRKSTAWMLIGAGALIPICLLAL